MIRMTRLPEEVTRLLTPLKPYFSYRHYLVGGVLDMEAMVPKLLILQNFRRRISTSGTPPSAVCHNRACSLLTLFELGAGPS